MHTALKTFFKTVRRRHERTPNISRKGEFMQTPDYEKGRELCERLHGKHSGAALIAALQKICPDNMNMTMEWSYAGITARPGLPLETRVLLLLACCICRGELPLQVKAYVEAGLGLGISKEAIVETILQTLPIVGFPAVTNALLSAEGSLAGAAA
jgi:4-carboxymuconolactone decarboxylase